MTNGRSGAGQFFWKWSSEAVEMLTNAKYWLFLIGLLLGGVLAPVKTFAQSCLLETMMNSNLPVRPEVKQYFDQLKEYSLIAVGHTTDSVTMSRSKNLLRSPKPFAAGRYKAIFQRDGEVRAVLVQTENKVGHFVTVTPGVTDIGGYVQLFTDPYTEVPDGMKLTTDELDYFIRTVYSRFCKPIEANEAMQFNQLKDMLLAIRFSAKPGIKEYHEELLSRLKSHK